MGIRGLKQLLKSKSPASTPEWKQFEKTKVGIDILPFLYNAKKQHLCIITCIAMMVEFFRSKQIEPIFFFDGKPPSEKKEVVKERSDERSSITTRLEHLTHELVDGPDKELVEHEIRQLQTLNPTVSYVERDVVKKSLYTMGVRYVNALGEADPLLAYLTKTKVLSAVISPDMDMLARGIEHLMMVNEMGDYVEYTLSTILKNLSLTMSQFQIMCVLMGTDYTPNVRYISAQIAYRTIVSSSEITLRRAWIDLRQRESDLPRLERAFTLLAGTEDTFEKLLNEKELRRWHADPPKVEPEEFTLLQSTYFPTLRTNFLQTPIVDISAGTT
jgi:5'-3' exonuclease